MSVRSSARANASDGRTAESTHILMFEDEQISRCDVVSAPNADYTLNTYDLRAGLGRDGTRGRAGALALVLLLGCGDDDSACVPASLANTCVAPSRRTGSSARARRASRATNATALALRGRARSGVR